MSSSSKVTVRRSYGPLGDMEATYLAGNGEIAVRWFEGPESRSTGSTLVELTWTATDLDEPEATAILEQVLDLLDDDDEGRDIGEVINR